MSQATLSPPGPRWLRVVLAPVHLVERSRGRRRLLILAAYGLIAAVAGVLGWRECQLAGVPDIGDPFDVAAARAAAPELPPDRDSFVTYREAARLYRDLGPGEQASFTKASHHWALADDTMRRWVADNRRAIDRLMEGSHRAGTTPIWPDSADAIQSRHAVYQMMDRLVWLSYAVVLDSGRLREEGDPAAAWDRLIAVIRASRHIEQVGGWYARHRGSQVIETMAGLVGEWGGDPAVDAALLRRAIADLEAAQAMTPPLSLDLRTEYLAEMQELDRSLDELAQQGDDRADESLWQNQMPWGRVIRLFLRHEPEQSRRLVKLLIANDLAQCDRPINSRPPVAVPAWHIYEADPAAPAATRAVSPGALGRRLDATRQIASLYWREMLEANAATERRILDSTKLDLAERLYQKENGRPSTTPRDLLGRYLKRLPDWLDDEPEPVAPPR